MKGNTLLLATLVAFGLLGSSGVNAAKTANLPSSDNDRLTILNKGKGQSTSSFIKLDKDSLTKTTSETGRGMTVVFNSSKADSTHVKPESWKSF